MAAPRIPTAGDEIGGYRIVRPLGQGGCGAVFEALDDRLGRAIALKVVLPSVAETVPGVSQRFKREIDVARRLEHAHVVRLYDFGETDDGLLWMAMELVDGRELQDVIRDEGAFEPARARRIALQILSGLAVAHDKQVVHRDLKPGNVMLCEEGADEDVAKVMDFGIGKALGPDEDPDIQNVTDDFGPSLGSPHYLAPEQLRRTDVGPHSDVYAVGLILFEMLTGHRAFDGDAIYEIMAKQAYEPVEMPDWLAGSELSAVLEKATAKDRNARFATARAFHEALRDTDVSGLVSTAASPEKRPLTAVGGASERRATATSGASGRRRLLLILALGLLGAAVAVGLLAL